MVLSAGLWLPAVAVNDALCQEPPKTHVTGGGEPAAVTTDAPVDSASERIAVSIRRLNADSFSAREAALQELAAEGQRVIDPIAAAIGQGNPEIDWRGITVLKMLMGSDDMATVMRAEMALDQIIEQSLQPTLSRMANEALEEQRIHQHPRAVTRIEALGGKIDTSQHNDGTTSTSVTIDEHWKGGDEGLWHLRRLMNLQTVAFDAAPISDEGLRVIGAKITIATLKIQNTPITDEALVHLSRLTSLSELHLCGTKITNTGVRQLKALGSLRSLFLADNDIGDASLQHLGALSQLRGLDLDSTAITDDGLAKLSACRNLVWFSLNDTRISDRGIEHLRPFSSLRRIYVKDTRISAEGQQQIQKIIPRVTVLR